MKTKSWISKSIKTVAAVALAAAAFASADSAKAVNFDYSSSPGSQIQFNGNSTFQFTPALNNFQVDTGTATGLMGEITGLYTIGVPVGNTAPVTGTGTFVIHDGAFNFSATLTWVNITQTGSIGGLNIFAQVNMTNMTYGGVNPDLVALASAANGINVLTFQFTTTHTIEDLRTMQLATSFSGTVESVTVPDGGTTVAFLGFALLGIAVLRRKMAAGSI